MKSFVDKNARAWSIVVNIATVKRVRALCDVNLLELITVDDSGKTDSSVLDKLSEDPVLLVDVLYAVCKPEADKLGITDVEFGESLDGDAIEKATESLLDEIVDFFPEAKRKVFRKILDATRKFQRETAEKIKNLVESEAFDNLIASRIQKLSNIGLDAPESSE
jgi:hypothetical protein